MAVHTDVFARLAASAARVNGLPMIRQAFVPQPVVSLSPEELRAYVDGDDPVASRPFMQVVVEGLTVPVEADVDEASFERSAPAVVTGSSSAELEELFGENGWTDHLPVVLPTRERVDAMLAGTSHAPDEVVGYLRPTAYREAWQSTVEKVAVNAVMAGARPEYLPVLLALAASGVTARPSSSGSPARMVVVNGPVREQIGLNSGIGALGPYSHANATIGRAYGLLSQNLQGGSEPELTYMGSQGNNLTYNSMTFAENEEGNPWEPFHVQHGFAPTDSTVSVFSGLLRTVAVTGGPRRTHWEANVRRVLGALAGMAPLQPPVLLLDPIVAEDFEHHAGFAAKADLARWVADNTRIPAAEFWDEQRIRTHIRPRALTGEEPWASYLRAGDDEPLRVLEPAQVSIVTVGGRTAAAWQIVCARHEGTFSIDEWR